MSVRDVVNRRHAARGALPAQGDTDRDRAEDETGRRQRDAGPQAASIRQRQGNRGDDHGSHAEIGRPAHALQQRGRQREHADAVRHAGRRQHQHGDGSEDEREHRVRHGGALYDGRGPRGPALNGVIVGPGPFGPGDNDRSCGWESSAGMRPLRTSLPSMRRSPDVYPARVAIEFNHNYRVYVDDGELDAVVAGRLKHRAEQPRRAAGRRRLGGRPQAARRGPRRDRRRPAARAARFSRKVAGKVTDEQVVAANVDVVFIVMALDADFSAAARSSAICCWRARAAPRRSIAAHQARPVRRTYRAQVAERRGGGRRRCPCTSSARSSTRASSTWPRISTAGRTGALLGSSGVGKSTIINRLVGERRAARRARCARAIRRDATPPRTASSCRCRRAVCSSTRPACASCSSGTSASAVRETFDDVEALGAGCHFTRLPSSRRAALRREGGGRRRAARRGSPGELPDSCRTSWRHLARAAGRARAARREAPGQDRRKALRRSSRTRRCGSNGGSKIGVDGPRAERLGTADCSRASRGTGDGASAGGAMATCGAARQVRQRRLTQRHGGSGRQRSRRRAEQSHRRSSAAAATSAAGARSSEARPSIAAVATSSRAAAASMNSGVTVARLRFGAQHQRAIAQQVDHARHAAGERVHAVERAGVEVTGVAPRATERRCAM